MTRSLLLILLAILSLNQSMAQQVLTVDAAVDLALRNNYDIRLAKNDSSSFALDNDYAWAAFLPRFNGTATKVWNTNAQKQELANGSKRDTSGLRSSTLQASLNMNLTLFDGFKMFATRERVAEIEKLGILSLRNQVVNTTAAVISNYYNIVRQKQQLKAILEQKSISEERVKLADKKLSVGLGAKPELLQAKVDLNAFTASQYQQNTLIEQLKEQLNQLIGFDKNAVYEVVDSIPIRQDLTLDEIRTDLENQSPQLLLARKNIDIAKLVYKERVGDRYPVVSFNSAYNLNRLTNQAVINNFTPLFNRNLGFNYGLSVTLPILNGLNAKRLQQQARIGIMQQELLLDNTRTLLDVQINNAFRDYELQKKNLALEEDNILLAKENVFIALERFKQGVSTYLELREAQISLADGYNRLIAARFNAKLAEIELMRLKGVTEY
ncbi:TolC family protein [Flavihumibacter cheonanensis]|uniref:TolC family protein n=1 Tax=Flavihumibacter cheonanensis TaxID=1442385 RepID=UPI001EF9AA9D|nr:TolC family protein [Flavihumibacter cheonanensis]MCG7751203.1 TolC family protein [Flavihumibacter cheonanensis]